jgi:hypothetical protein
MKRILLLTLCLVFALSGVALAQNVHISGQAKVFDIFGAVGANVAALEADGVTAVGGSNTAVCNFDGTYAIDTDVPNAYARFGCYVHGDATYFGGFLHVIGNSPAFNVAVGAGNTSITGVNLALY